MDHDEGVHEELALFELPPQDATVESEEIIEYRPVGQDGVNSSSVQFNIPANNAFFVDLKSSTLKVTVKIVKEDSTAVGEGDAVTLNNLPLHNMWSQVDISLGQQLVSQGVNNNYPYKAVFDTLLFNDVPEACLSSQGYFRDIPGMLAMTDPTRLIPEGDEDMLLNSGLIYRHELTRKGQGVQFEGPLFADLWQQKRYLPNGLDIGVKLWHSQDKFRLIAPETLPGCKLVLLDAVLKMRMVRLTPQALVAVNENGTKTQFKYPYERSEIKCYNVPSGQYDFTVDDIFNGDVPEKIAIGLVSSKSYSGNYTKTPFEFKPFALNFMAFYKNGKSVPSVPLTPNYAGDDYISAYMTVVQDPNMYRRIVSRGDFKGGYALYLLDLSAKREKNSLSPEPERGHTRFVVRFADPLTEPVTIVVYAKFASVMEVDATRNVTI
jgi:hypothetical protein